MMGANDGDSDEKPVHRVELDGFCMDVTEVTVEAYARCVSAGSCTKPDTGRWCNWGQSGKGNHPINCVDWDQATAYCRWAGKELPTEAQWEYAARGGSRQLEYPWGSEAPGSRACWKRSDGTCPVGSYLSGDSPFGLHDMAGNVWEWVQDWYGRYPSSSSKNYAGPSSGSNRVDRGGSWGGHGPSYLRGSARYHVTPDIRSFSLGFRCARTR
jgi:formylglycine-generating enzyme required for sulfatase activity